MIKTIQFAKQDAMTYHCALAAVTVQTNLYKIITKNTCQCAADRPHYRSASHPRK